MNLKVMLKTTLFDVNGSIINETEQEANSFVGALIGIMRSQMAGARDSISFKDIFGTLMTPNQLINNFQLTTNDASHNIIVGTSSQGVAVGDNKLVTPITSGAGAGQLVYGAPTIGSLTITGSQYYFTITRTFQNSSGGTIVVNEVALYCDANNAAAGITQFCLDRTLDNKTVLNGQTLQEQYAIIVIV